MAKVLLIGGTGLLSSEILFLAVQKGYDVSIINRGNRKINVPASVKVIHADINNVTEISSLLEAEFYDVVVDFISYTINDISRSLSIFKDKTKQFIFISSACAYRRAPEDGVLTENSPLVNPNWVYSINKVACEKFFIETCEKAGIFYTIIRPYITYGNTRIPYGIMPPYGQHWTLVARILNNKPIFLWDDGNTVCTLTHVKDFAKGAVGLFNNPKAYNESFHITNDEKYRWIDVINTIGKVLGKEPTIVNIPSTFAAQEMPEISGMLLGDRSLDAEFDNTKIKNAVSEFSCEINLSEGLLNTINHYKNNNYLNGIDYKWDAQIDRLINNYIKKEKERNYFNSKSLSFKNYLSNASFNNKITYFVYRYSPKVFIKVYKRLK